MIRSGKGGEAAIEIIVAFSHGTFPKDLMYLTSELVHIVGAESIKQMLLGTGKGVSQG